MAHQKRWWDTPSHGPTILVMDEHTHGKVIEMYDIPTAAYGVQVFDSRIKHLKSKYQAKKDPLILHYL